MIRRCAMLIVIWLCSAAWAQPQALQAVDFDPQPGAQVPMQLRFVNQDGREVTLADCANNQPAVLVLAYYRCPMLCTMVLQTLVRSLRQVPYAAGQTYQVIVVSIDPREQHTRARQTWEDAVRQYGRDGAGPGFHFLTDPHRQAAQVADAIGYRYAFDEATDQYAHPAGIVLLTPDGRAARYILGLDYPPRDLRLALVEASEGKIASNVVERVLLRCYRYDPATGRYGLVVTRLLRVAGLSFAVLGTIGMAWLWRRDRRLTAAQQRQIQPEKEP